MSGQILFGLTIFLSALLAFQIQPLIAKLILPWFGGAAAVWTTCLVFFQVVLLLGYAYAHGLTSWFRPANQTRIHLTLLAVSLLALPVIPDPGVGSSVSEEPAFRVLVLLAHTVGLPYFVLTSASPLLQAWLAGERGDIRVYRLYALSNAGSLLAVLSYPALVEPFLATRVQAVSWSVTYGLVCVLSAAVAIMRRNAQPSQVLPEKGTPPAWSVRILWLALPACASALLLSITNHLSQNLAAIPLLWVIPLSLYLLSFVLTFTGPGWYRRNLMLRLLAVALGALAYALQPQFASASLILLVPLFCAGLFVCCVACHGELARLKPAPEYLTSFYLMVSLGGALGGMFVALVAPRVFSGYFELPVTLGACAVLILAVLHRDPQCPFFQARWQPAWLVVMTLAVGINLSLLASVYKQIAESKVMARNFFGALRETEVDYTPSKVGRGLSPVSGKAPRRRQLINGPIQHGLQLLAEDRKREPTAYYGPNSGVGLALRVAAEREVLRVGVVGLGVGTVAAYGRPGDHYAFYEINPQVIELANRDFTFLRDSAADIEILTGDARLSLEGQAPQNFDLLAVDAFSGDAIPVHLLTREAFAVYFRHTKPHGTLAVHISNSYLNLLPVVERAAAWFGKPAVSVRNDSDEANGILRSTWVLITDRRDLLESREIRRAGIPLARTSDFRLWTDDYSNLFGILKWVLGS